MLNAIEPGSPLPIHRHRTRGESFVILRGKVGVTTHKDDGSVIEDVVLRQERRYFEFMTLKGVLNGIWQFCRYLFWPQWGSKYRRVQEKYERMLEEGRVK